MKHDPWLVEAYFQWLLNDCFRYHKQKQQYEGVLRELHAVPFYWTIWSDENRAGDALSFRQYEFLQFQDVKNLDQVWLGQWATATPSVLEVLIGIARRWSFYFEDDVDMYFGHLFKNLGMDRYPGKMLNFRTEEEVRIKIDDWLSRQFQPDGQGSPFPVSHAFDIIDMRKKEIWAQMNAYSAEHFQ